MTDPTKAVCSVCHQERRVFVESWADVLGKRHVWRECPRCFAVAEGRAIAAIEQAEKAGVA